MIKLQTFDNFLTPLRLFRPWKAVEAVNDDAAYHFFPPKWRQWLTPEYFIYLLLRISRTRTRPRFRIKGLYYSTITSICTWKTTVLLTYREAKGKNQQWGKQNIHFLFVRSCWKTEPSVLQYWAHWDMRYTPIHVCIQIFEWHRPNREYLRADTCKRFFQNIWNHIFHSKVLKFQGISAIWERAEQSSSRLGV